MLVGEIEIPINGKKEDIDKLLLTNGFNEFFKVCTITSYYLKNDDKNMEHSTLKERCKRIRYVEPLTKFKNINQDYEKWIKEYDLEQCLEEENELINSGYHKIYTDEKTDYVYKNKIEEDMYFQIQDIKDDCLMIAYDNKKYYELDEKEQREKLISDVEKYGIEILDDKNIDRFKLLGKTLSIEEIIDRMNDCIKQLYDKM